jgi:hypothetical protein
MEIMRIHLVRQSLCFSQVKLKNERKISQHEKATFGHVVIDDAPENEASVLIGF